MQKTKRYQNYNSVYITIIRFFPLYYASFYYKMTEEMISTTEEAVSSINPNPNSNETEVNVLRREIAFLKHRTAEQTKEHEQ